MGLDFVDPVLGIDCKYCKKRIEGYSDGEIMVALIYHLHENHKGEKE